MTSWDTIDRYMILSSDTHAGAEMRQYKHYLDARWHDEFEAWADAVVFPWIDMRDIDAVKINWDSAARTAACDAEGITGEVIFPNTLTPFYDILVHLSGVPATAAEYARRAAGLRRPRRNSALPRRTCCPSSARASSVVAGSTPSLRRRSRRRCRPCLGTRFSKRSVSGNSRSPW